MPSAIPQHKPRKPLPDDRVRLQDRARHAGRALPYNGSQWQAIRKAVLDKEPLCRGCGEVARVVDHIDGNNGNNGFDNLRPLCEPCHNQRTMLDRRAREKSLECFDSDTGRLTSHAAPRIARTGER
jgi:5-methylcytosine-specific restriction endonuclease McrA